MHIDRRIVRILFVSSLIVASASGHDPGTELAVSVLAKSTQSWDGTDLPDFSEKQTEVTVLKITIPPRTRMALHKHPIINAGYMVSGRLTVHSENGRTLDLKAGDAIVEMVEGWHYGDNTSHEPATIVVVYVGPFGERLSIKKE